MGSIARIGPNRDMAAQNARLKVILSRNEDFSEKQPAIYSKFAESQEFEENKEIRKSAEDFDKMRKLTAIMNPNRSSAVEKRTRQDLDREIADFQRPLVKTDYFTYPREIVRSSKFGREIIYLPSIHCDDDLHEKSETHATDIPGELIMGENNNNKSSFNGLLPESRNSSKHLLTFSSTEQKIVPPKRGRQKRSPANSNQTMSGKHQLILRTSTTAGYFTPLVSVQQKTQQSAFINKIARIMDKTPHMSHQSSLPRLGNENMHPLLPVTATFSDDAWTEETSPVEEPVTPEFIGFANLGNTCYLNSLLQALTEADDFVEQILQVKSGTHKLLSTFQELFLARQHSSNEVKITLERLLQEVMKCTGFKPSQQQDVGECLIKILDKIAEVEPSIVANFEISYVEEYDCDSCKHKSSKQEQGFRMLSLPINKTSPSPQSVQTLIDNQKGTCTACNNNASYSYIFQQVPRYLVLQLNRFEGDVTLNTVSKIETEVDVSETLKIKVRDSTSGEESVRTYQLSSVVCHLGTSVNGGHYISEVFRKKVQDWFKYNDREVEKLRIVNIQSQCYILFYALQ